MNRKTKEILSDIERTIDQYKKNVDLLENVPLSAMREAEVSALSNTQDSLLAHLAHMQEHLRDEGAHKIEEGIDKRIKKLRRYNQSLIQELHSKVRSTRPKRRPFFGFFR